MLAVVVEAIVDVPLSRCRHHNSHFEMVIKTRRASTLFSSKRILLLLEGVL